jgi:uncharacterized protein
MDPLITTLESEVKTFLEKSACGHDFHHAQRVFKASKTIQEKEGGDFFIIGCSALVHDICRPWEKETGKSHFGEEAIEIIREVLVRCKIPQPHIESILEVVRHHDIYDWTDKKSKSIELQVMQDADRLDAIGAMGVSRAFAFGGSANRPIYIPDENLAFDKDFVDNPNNRTSTIAHFYEKLLKLKDNMNTPTGKQMALERHHFMETFLNQFFNEWEGKA